MSLKCVKLIDSSKRAYVCFWCEGKPTAEEQISNLEEQGHEVTAGICNKCIDHFKATSLKGSNWELKI